MACSSPRHAEFRRGGRTLTGGGELEQEEQAQELEGRTSKTLTGLSRPADAPKCCAKKKASKPRGEPLVSRTVYTLVHSGCSGGLYEALASDKQDGAEKGKATSPRQNRGRTRFQQPDGVKVWVKGQGCGSGTEVRTQARSPPVGCGQQGALARAAAGGSRLLKARDPWGLRCESQGSCRCGWDGGMAGRGRGFNTATCNRRALPSVRTR